MPSAISHVAVAASAGLAFAPKAVPDQFWYLAIICSIIPDADIIGLYFGVPYGHFFGHRGFFHSFFFSLLLSVFIVFFFFRDAALFSRPWFFYFVFFFLLMASHGILDAFTNGGLGIALLSPFDTTRYFFPWTPIAVSPVGIRSFFSNLGLAVMKNELLWIWLPSSLIVAVSLIFRAVAARQ